MTKKKNSQEEGMRKTVLRTVTVDGRKEITGRVWYADAPFEFSLKEQKSGVYQYRGSVRAVSMSGKTLKRRGKLMREIMSSGASNSSKEQKIRVTKSIHFDGNDETEIIAKVEAAAKTLFKENAALITENMRGNVTPESITLSVAADVYGYQFVNKKHTESSDDRKNALIKKLKNAAEKFPLRPMLSISKEKAKGLILEAGFGEPTVQLLFDFWQYCLEESICEGENPIEKIKLKKRTNRSKQLAAMRVDELSYDQFVALCDKLAKDGNGISAGIALMASGFKPAEIDRLTWGDLAFRKEHDHVVVKLNLNERGGATQNYSRPMLPLTAKIIRDRYDMLRDKYSGIDITEWPVASVSTDSKKKIKKTILIQEATRALKSIAVSNTVFASLREEDRSLAAATTLLGNTYERILRDRCKLNDDEGTVTFLLGKSFGSDTTSNNYTSFTSEYGERRLYELLKCVKKETTHREVLKTSISGSIITTTCLPVKTSVYATVKATIVLAPGESVRMLCRHGVTGEYRVFDQSDR